MAESKIEWTDRSDWNPVRGCSRVSPGCGGPGDHGGCYAEGMAARFSKPGMWGHGFAEMQNGKPRWTGKVELQEDRLTIPLSWKKPAKVFVNSTSDIFHEALPDEAIDKIFAVMALCPQHTFQVLTKRAERMRAYLGSRSLWDRVWKAQFEVKPAIGHQAFDWPLPNVWLGVSCERQQEADERIPHLLQTPAAIRFVSAEPLLGPIDLFGYMGRGGGWQMCPGDVRRLDWIIVGGESGPHARPMHPQWARDIRNQCHAADVAFFFKQWGEWFPWLHFNDNKAVVDENAEQSRFPARIWCEEGNRWDEHSGCWDDDPGAAGPDEPDQIMGRVGKKSAGRLLDGKEHSAFPNPRPSSLEATTRCLRKGERVVVGADEGSR